MHAQTIHTETKQKHLRCAYKVYCASIFFRLLYSLWTVCVLFLGIQGDDTCPGLPLCFCNKDRTSVNCEGKHFKSIPNVPSTAEKLYLRYNDFTNISAGVFKGLPNLQKLYLDHNKIAVLEPFAFDGLINLNYLDLRNNKIIALGNSSLAGLPKLDHLYLTTNKIKSVADNAFNGSSSLVYVSLQANQLTTVPPLGHQPYLSQLILEGNAIVDATFPSSYKTCSRNTGIVLSNNEIKELKNSTFESLSNSSFSKLYLSRNEIKSIESGTFANLFSVKSLKLGSNPLNSLVLKSAVSGLAGKDVVSLDISGIELNGVLMEDTFSLLKNTTLNSLIMRFNKIKLIQDNTFSQLNSLIMLDLSSSEISSAHDNAFNGLSQLSTLKLNDNHFTSIPRNLPPSIRYLYLDDNQIDTIESDVFNNLVQLRELWMSYNAILTLESGAFNGLMNLVKLKLHNNKINTLPGGVFSPLVRLQSLDLGKNNLYTIQTGKDRFSSLVALVYLNLADNQCSFFQPDLFKPLLSLKYLHLERNNLGRMFSEDYGGEMLEELKKLEELHVMNNNIEALPEPTLKNLLSLKVLNASHNKISTWGPNLFKSTQKLSTLDLSYNLIATVKQEQLHDLSNLNCLNLTGSPFMCNCDLRWFRDWVNQTNTVITNVGSYTCNGPSEWKGKPLLEFSRSKINCLFFTKYAIIGAVVAALLIALLIFGMIYKNRWRIRLRWYKLSKRGRRFLQRPKAADGRGNYGAIPDQETFDAYVSCSEYDTDWALANLLPGIDNGELNEDNKFNGVFRLYYEDRDATPGKQVMCL